MADYRVLNQLLLAKIEAVSGVEETPAVASEAIKTVAISYSPNFDVLDTDDEHTGNLDTGDPIVGGGSTGISFGVIARGSGAAGAAPEYDPLLQASGFGVTTTAADVTGTAQAGAASTITLAAGASAVNDAYNGMVIATTGGTGDGQTRVIADYVGSTKVATVSPAWTTTPDATTTYAIHANNLYIPASTSLVTATLWAYQHSTAAAGESLLRKLVGAAGNMSLEIVNNAIGRMSFAFTGIMPALPTNVAHPGAATFDNVKAEAFKNAKAFLGGAAVKFNRVTLDCGNEVSQADDPAQTFGLDVAGIVRRKMTGTINPNLIALATRDNMSDFLAGTPQSLWLAWGSAAGRRVSLYMPSVYYTGVSPTDNRGFAAEELAFQVSEGELYLCIY